MDQSINILKNQLIERNCTILGYISSICHILFKSLLAELIKWTFLFS
jgi:hypothetical protein